MIKERRKHPRLRIPLEAEYLVAGREEWRQGTIWTLGAGGAALLCEEELDRGTALEGLHFVVEAEGDLPETRIEVGAEVVSIDRKADFGRPSNFMLGLQFTGLGEQEFELLKQFVFRRLTGPQRSSRDAEEGDKAAESAPPIEIRFKLFDEFVEEVSDNLSPSGMFISAHRPLPPGSRFVFQFQLGEDFSLFQGTAEVVWTRRRSEGPERPSGMGVRFLKLDLTSQKMVTRLVGEHEDAQDAEAGEVEEETEAAAAPRDGGPKLELVEEAEPFTFADETQPPTGSQPEPDPQPAAPARDTEREATKRTARLQRSLAKLEKRLEEVESARDEAEQKAAGLDSEAEALRQENKALQVTCDEAEEARGRAEAEALELQRELETLRPDEDLPDEELAEQLLAAREELERRQEEWHKLEAELRGNLERGATAEVELRETLEGAVETEAALRQSLEQAAGTEAELRGRLEEVAADRDDLERQTERADEAESRLQLIRQESAEARREWDATEAELRAQLEQKSGESSELEERLTEAVGAEAELRQRLSELRGARDELEQQLAGGAEVEAELSEQARELRAVRDQLQARLQRSTAQLARMRGVAEEMKSRFNGDLTEARELGEDLANRLAEVAAAGSGLDEKVSRLTASRAGLADRLARITDVWSSLESGLDEVGAEDTASDAPLLAERAESAPEEAEAELEEAAEAELPEEAQSSEEAQLSEESDPAEELTAAAVEPEASPEGPEPEASPEEPEPEASPEEPELEAALEEPAPEATPEEPEPEIKLAEAPEVPVAPLAEEPDELAEPMQPVAEATVDAVEEPEQPKESGAARLVGVARRAVARLGFGQRSANGGSGDGDGVDMDLSQVLENKTEPVVVDEPSTPAEIEETVRAWAAAWSERRVEDYLAFYSREFEPAEADEGPESGEAAHAWLPPLAGMELTLGPISQTEMEPGRFAVQFEQSVESDSYTRRTGRTLEMVLEADAWKIAAESFQDLPNW